MNLLNVRCTDKAMADCRPITDYYKPDILTLIPKTVSTAGEFCCQTVLQSVVESSLRNTLHVTECVKKK